MGDLEAAYRRTVLIGGVMAASVFTYVLVAVVIGTLQEQFTGFWPGLSEDTAKQLGYALLAACVVELAVIHFLKARFSSHQPVASSTALLDAAAIDALVCKLVSTHVAAFMLAESMAVFGFVFFLLTGKMTELTVFVGLSLAAFAFSFPRLARWQEWLRQRSGTY